MVLHGRDDTAVPVARSIGRAEVVRKRIGDEMIDLHVEPGEHCYDRAVPLHTPWLKLKLVKVPEPRLGRKED
jgi:hypothetical protein